MNTTLPDAIQLADGLKRRIGRLRNVDIAVVPPAPFIHAVAQRLHGERIHVGAQDLHPKPSGAFTGAVSAAQLRSAGASFVLVGHSERRHVFGDGDDDVAAKLQAALENDLDVILCIGETLEQRESGATFELCQTQLQVSLADVSQEQMARVTVAYEPVWAIGTGRTASPAQAQEVHRFVREWLEDRFDVEVSSQTRIQYGGSVKPNNVGALLAGADVDGALVGGASLDVSSFTAIVCSASGGRD